MRSFWCILICVLLVGCYDGDRNNPFDPELTPVVELGAVAVEDTSGAAILEWTEYEGRQPFEAYRILRKVKGLEAVDTLGVIEDVHRTTFRDTTLAPDVEYVYRVAVVNGGGFVVESEEREVSYRLPPVELLGVEMDGITGTAELRWSEYRGPDFESYRIYRQSGNVREELVGEVVEVDRTTYTDSLLDGNTYHTYRIGVYTEWGVEAFSYRHGGIHNEWMDTFSEGESQAASVLRTIDLALDEEDNPYFGGVWQGSPSQDGLWVLLLGEAERGPLMAYIGGGILGEDRLRVRSGSPVCLTAGQGKVYVAGASEEGTIWVVAMDEQEPDAQGLVGRKLWIGEVETDGSYPVGLHLMENGAVLMVDEQGMMYRFGADGSYEGREEKTHTALSGGGYLPLAGAAFGPRLGPAEQDVMIFVAPEGMTAQLISYYWNDKGGFYKRWSPIGGIGTEKGQIIKPSAVTVDKVYRRIIAVDVSGRLQIFSIDPVERGPHRYITGWGRYGEGDGEFVSARAITVDVEVDSGGRIYVTDIVGGGTIRIQVFEP